jgi:phosphate transport system protein
MERHFDHELNALKDRLLTMASHAEAAVNQSVEALTNRDLDLALRVKEDDSMIDQFEIEIDDLAIQMLAKAPLASDLRFVTVAMKISQNLERVGDEAAKIAKRARDLSKEPPLKLAVDLPKMAGLALGMLKAALDSFVQRDPAAARAVIPQDQIVDALHKEIQRQLTKQMTENAETITRCLNLMVAAKSLERIADHATNVAEEVVYLCEAHDIRHPGNGPPASGTRGIQSL